MSADNYWLIRRWGERFVVSMEFLSEEQTSPLEEALEQGNIFYEVDEAFDYADAHHVEYGVMTEDGVFNDE